MDEDTYFPVGMAAGLLALVAPILVGVSPLVSTPLVALAVVAPLALGSVAVASSLRLYRTGETRIGLMLGISVGFAAVAGTLFGLGVVY